MKKRKLFLNNTWTNQRLKKSVAFTTICHTQFRLESFFSTTGRDTSPKNRGQNIWMRQDSWDCGWTIWKDLVSPGPTTWNLIARPNEVNLRFSLHIGLAFFVDGPTISYLISAAADVNEQLNIPIMRKGGLVGCLLGWRKSESSKKLPSVEAMEGTRTAKKVRCNAGVHLH